MRTTSEDFWADQCPLRAPLHGGVRAYTFLYYREKRWRIRKGHRTGRWERYSEECYGHIRDNFHAAQPSPLRVAWAMARIRRERLGQMRLFGRSPHYHSNRKVTVYGVLAKHVRWASKQ